MIYNSKEGDIVYQYINFCKVFDKQKRLYPDNKDKAIKETLRICTDKALLDDYIKKHISEVYDTMSDYIFNDEVLMRIHIKNETRLAREKAHEEGLAEGRTEGLAEGRAEGLTEGREEKSFEIAKNLLSMGFSLEKISQATSLPLDKVTELQAELQTV